MIDEADLQFIKDVLFTKLDNLDKKFLKEIYANIVEEAKLKHTEEEWRVIELAGKIVNFLLTVYGKGDFA